MTPFPDTPGRQREVIGELTDRPPRFLIYVHLEGSFLEDEGTPTDLREFLNKMCQNQYLPVAWVAAGDSAVRGWPSPSAESRGIPSGATVTIWQRRPNPR
jgi:hypothetical protein